jgi:hypothetical protein
MGVELNTYSITTLNSTNSFYDWFLKENTDIIGKLNLLKVYGATSGDGILATTDTSGLLTLSIGGTSGIIKSPLIFNNTVTFNGQVNVGSVNVQIYGMTAGAGYTFGMPVRVYQSGSAIGYTAARANNPENAEVMGIVTSVGNTYSFVTVAGKIEGDFTTSYGKGLSAGCVYFLDPTNQGKITDEEPAVTGYVSKPLLLGLSGNAAIILPYRGNYLNSDLTSYGSSGSNQIVIIIDSAYNADGDFSYIDVGDIFSYSPSYAASGALQTGRRSNYGGWFHSMNLPNELNYIVGVIINKTIDGSGDAILTIQLSGYTNVYDIETNGGIYLTNSLDLADKANSPQWINTGGDPGTYLPIATIYDDSSDSAVINIRSVGGQSNVSLISTSGAATYVDNTVDNVLVNGNFEVWQRSEIGRENQYTTTGNVVFADLWRRHDGLSGDSSTKNYYIIRQSFADYQNEIEGNPNYYIDVKALGATGITYPGLINDEYPSYGSYNHVMVGHVVPGCKVFDGKKLAVSFYGKTSHSSYNDVNVYLARYAGTTLLDYKVLGTASLGTNWNRYDFNVAISGLTSSATPIENDYCEIGFDLIPLITQARAASESIATNVFISLASVNAGAVDGNIQAHNFKTYDEQLRYCRQFYYSTYSRSERVGSPTMISTFDVAESTAIMVPIPNYSEKVHELNIEMRTTPSVTIYSPYSGSSSEAYNKTANRELILCNGTYGYGGAERTYTSGDRITATARINSVRISAVAGNVPYDKIYYHFVADADYPI